MKKFEYKIIAPDLMEEKEVPSGFVDGLPADKLNKLGLEGWELVSAIPQKQLGDTTGYLSLDPRSEIVFILKREIK